MVAIALAACFFTSQDCDDKEGQTRSNISFKYNLTAVDVPKKDNVHYGEGEREEGRDISYTCKRQSAVIK